MTRLAALFLLPALAGAQQLVVRESIPISWTQAVVGQLSHDGTKLVYSNGLKLEVLDLETHKRSTLCDLSSTIIFSMEFSPKSDLVYFRQFDPPSPSPSLYSVPTAGGQKRKIADTAAWFSVSPDGKQILLRATAASNADLSVIGTDGKGLRTLVEMRGRILSFFWQHDDDSVQLIAVEQGGIHDSKAPTNAWVVDRQTGAMTATRLKPLPPCCYVLPSQKPPTPSGGRIYRFKPDRQKEFLTPERDRYLKVLKTFDNGSRVMAVKVRDLDFWDGFIATVFPRGIETELVTLVLK